MSLADGFLYAVTPALVGAGLAIAQIRAADRGPRGAAPTPSPALLLMGMAFTAPILALVATLLAADAVRDVRLQLMVLGGAALLQAGLHGILAARALPEIRSDPTRLARALLPIALTEAIVIAPFAWIVAIAGAPM